MTKAEDMLGIQKQIKTRCWSSEKYAFSRDQNH